MKSNRRQSIFRCIPALDDDDSDDEYDFSPHWSSALQIICHTLRPLRNALIHFSLNYRTKFDSNNVEFKFLMELGKFFQTLVGYNKDENAEEVDPIPLYKALEAVIEHTIKIKKMKRKSTNGDNNGSNTTTSNTKTAPDPFLLSTQPKTATAAIHILFEMIQRCARNIPVTSVLWLSLLDACGLGVLSNQSIVGKRQEPEHDEMIQRTKRETCLAICPFLLPGKYDSVDKGLENTMKKQPMSADKTNGKNYDWDGPASYDFEVRIPLGWGDEGASDESNNIDDIGVDDSITQNDEKKADEKKEKNDRQKQKWKNTKQLEFQSIPNFLFLGLERFRHQESDSTDDDSDDDSEATKKILNPSIKVPTELDISKYCTDLKKNKHLNTKFELVGGILYDGDDYVAICKVPKKKSPQEQEQEQVGATLSSDGSGTTTTEVGDTSLDSDSKATSKESAVLTGIEAVTAEAEMAASTDDDEVAIVEAETYETIDDEAATVDAETYATADDEAITLDAETYLTTDDEGYTLDTETYSTTDDEAITIDAETYATTDDEAASVDDETYATTDDDCSVSCSADVDEAAQISRRRNAAEGNTNTRVVDNSCKESMGMDVNDSDDAGRRTEEAGAQENPTINEVSELVATALAKVGSELNAATMGASNGGNIVDVNAEEDADSTSEAAGRETNTVSFEGQEAVAVVPAEVAGAPMKEGDDDDHMEAIKADNGISTAEVSGVESNTIANGGIETVATLPAESGAGNETTTTKGNGDDHVEVIEDDDVSFVAEVAEVRKSIILDERPEAAAAVVATSRARPITATIDGDDTNILDVNAEDDAGNIVDAAGARVLTMSNEWLGKVATVPAEAVTESDSVGTYGDDNDDVVVNRAGGACKPERATGAKMSTIVNEGSEAVTRTVESRIVPKTAPIDEDDEGQPMGVDADDGGDSTKVDKAEATGPETSSIIPDRPVPATAASAEPGTGPQTTAIDGDGDGDSVSVMEDDAPNTAETMAAKTTSTTLDEPEGAATVPEQEGIEGTPDIADGDVDCDMEANDADIVNSNLQATRVEKSSTAHDRPGEVAKASAAVDTEHNTVSIAGHSDDNVEMNEADDRAEAGLTSGTETNAITNEGPEAAATVNAEPGAAPKTAPIDGDGDGSSYNLDVNSDGTGGKVKVAEAETVSTTHGRPGPVAVMPVEAGTQPNTYVIEVDGDDGVGDDVADSAGNAADYGGAETNSIRNERPETITETATESGAEANTSPIDGKGDRDGENVNFKTEDGTGKASEAIQVEANSTNDEGQEPVVITPAASQVTPTTTVADTDGNDHVDVRDGGDGGTASEPPGAKTPIISNQGAKVVAVVAEEDEEFGAGCKIAITKRDGDDDCDDNTEDGISNTVEAIGGRLKTTFNEKLEAVAAPPAKSIAESKAVTKDRDGSGNFDIHEAEDVNITVETPSISGGRSKTTEAPLTVESGARTSTYSINGEDDRINNNPSINVADNLNDIVAAETNNIANEGEGGPSTSSADEAKASSKSEGGNGNSDDGDMDMDIALVDDENEDNEDADACRNDEDNSTDSENDHNFSIDDGVDSKEDDGDSSDDDYEGQSSDDDSSDDSSSDDDDDSNECDTDEVFDWKLLESDEIIPMTEKDVLQFLCGRADEAEADSDDSSEDGGVFGTVLVYRSVNSKAHEEVDHLLSDIIMSHVTGQLEGSYNFYHEEELIEEIVYEDTM